MVVNYFADDVRDSPINLTVARFLLSVYLFWKLVSIDWQEIYAWPVAPVDDLTAILVLPEWMLIIEVVSAGVLLAIFGAGYRTHWSGAGAALLVMHVTGVRMILTSSGDTVGLVFASYFILIIALFSGNDRLSVDALRQTSTKSIDELNSHLQDRTVTATAMPALKYSLLILGLLYFFSAFDKAIEGPLLAWVTGDNLGLYMANRIHLAGFERSLVGVFFDWPILLWIGAIGTIVLEAGFLIAILLGITLWPFVLGLIGMHLVIALTIGPFFFDQMIFYGLFVPWDRLYARAVRSDSITVVYDEHCYFCNQALYLFPYLDINDTVAFHSQYSVPDAYQDRNDVDFETAMYVFRDDTASAGYWAFRELLRQFRIFAPIVWMMGRSPVAAVGERIYQYIADNRSRHFTCRVDLSD